VALVGAVGVGAAGLVAAGDEPATGWLEAAVDGVTLAAATGALAVPAGADVVVGFWFDVHATTARSNTNATTPTMQVFRFIPTPLLSLDT
jgi:hypothetical protein